MRSLTDHPACRGDGPLLDLEALETFAAPRRLSRDEGRAVAGPDWSRSLPILEQEPDDD